MVGRRAAVAFELFVRRHRELAEGHAGHAPDARQLDDLGQRQWRDRYADPPARPRSDRGAHEERGAQRSVAQHPAAHDGRSEEHTSELQSLMRISYAVFCLTKKIKIITSKDKKERE